MVRLVALRPTVVAWLCGAVAVADASTANLGHTHTTTRLSAGVEQQDMGVSSKNTEDNSPERFGSGCFVVEGKGENRCAYIGKGSDSDPQIAGTSVGDTVDLGELADRVSDALVPAVDADLVGSKSSSPGSTSPGCSAQTTGALSNEGEQGSGDVQEERVAAAAHRDGAGNEKALEVGVGRSCGEGEHESICNQDEECCNSSCGICAPRGYSCLQIACGVLSRGGGSKVQHRLTSSSQIWTCVSPHV